MGLGLAEAVPACDAADVARAVAVREAIYALVTARLGEAPLRRGALALVNAIAPRHRG